jgi:transcriptional regulator with XRE-family HTH domain
MKQLREIIRDLREDHDLKQIEVASYLGVAQQTYSNYENGNRDIPIDIVIKLSRFYKVSTDYLLGAEHAYPGSSNLSKTYLGNVTMHDVVYDIQKFNPRERRDLLKYISFLKSTESQN